MNAEQLLAHFETVTEAPDAVNRLRRFVLDLAIRGKLLPQDRSEEVALDLLTRIGEEKVRQLNATNARALKTAPALPEAPFLIPPNWSWTQLADIGILSPHNEAPDSLEASFVPMGLIAAEYGVPHKHEVRAWALIKKGYTHFAEGDVGLAKITPCFENGKSTVFRNLTGGIGSGTTELHIVRPILVDSDYVLLFLKSPYFVETGARKMTGTAGQKRVPTAYFAHSPFPLPPLNEQKRIVIRVAELMTLCDQLERARIEREAMRDRLAVSCLTRLNKPTPETFQDDSRFVLNSLSALASRPDQIRHLRQTIRNLAVRGMLVPQDPKDEPASQLLKTISNEIAAYTLEQQISPPKPDPIRPEDQPFALPDGWRWSRLCELFKVVTDGDHQPPPKATEGVAFLTIGNITTGRLDFSGCRLVSETYFKSLAPYRTPAKGDMLYTVVGATYGRPAIVDTDRSFCVQRHIAIMKSVKSMNLRFIAILLASPLVYDQASRSTTGSAQPTIALRPLRNFLVPLPPINEQRRIVAKVDALITLCDQLEASLIQAISTRGRLLDVLLAEALAPAA